jgi:MFS family permease
MAVSRAFLVSPPFLRIWLLSFAAGSAGFQLFPTAPLRLTATGAPPSAAGSFLAALTFASAISAAWTGALGDRLGRRRVLTGAGIALSLLAFVYSLPLPWPFFVALAVPHGAVWSALLTAASSEAARVVPPERRTEGLGYHGMAMSVAIAIAPSVGFLLLDRGWAWLCGSLVVANLLVAGLARALPADPPVAPGALRGLGSADAVDWSALRVSGVLLACSIGYGGATSFVALLCRARGIAPEGIYFTGLAVAILVLRPLAAPWVDRFGPRHAILPCVLAIAGALAWLPFQTTAAGVLAGGLLLGAGFSTLYPAFASLVLSRTAPARVGAAFGAMLAAFDIGIGFGSLGFGPVVERWGYPAAFVGSAAVALGAVPLLARGARRWEARPAPEGRSD